MFWPMTRFVSRRQPLLLLLPPRILGARGWTPLHWAAQYGHAAVVEQLISAGAKVDAASTVGRGPGRVFGLFWEWLWRGDGRGSYMGRGFSCCALRALSGTCCLRIHFCDGDGPVEIRVYKKWPNMEGKGMSGTESRPLTNDVAIFSLIWFDANYSGCFGYWAAKATVWAAKATDISQWKREGGAEDAAHENVGQQA